MAKSYLIDTNPLYMELFEAITHFWGRQQLVLRVIVNQGVSLEELPRGVSAWFDKTPQHGTWAIDWEFMFHGGGCELKNLRTGEPIDWNGPTGGFSPLSFIHHLMWRLEQGHLLPYLRDYITQHDQWKVYELIQDLVRDGLISTGYQLLPYNQADAA